MSIEYNTISNISELLNEYGREYQIIPNNHKDIYKMKTSSK